MAFNEKYITDTGAGAHDGSSEANAWTIAEAIAAPYAAGDRLNIKAGTHAQTTNARNFNINGTATAPVVIRGYNTTIGDCDSDPTLTKPAITFTTGLLTFSGTHTLVQNLDITSQNTGRAVSVSGANFHMDRCRVENTNAAAGSHAITLGISAVLSRSWFKATSSATRVVLLQGASAIQGCVVRGGGVGIESQSVAAQILGNIIIDVGSHGFQIVTTGAVLVIIGNTIYSAGGDGIRLDVLPSSYCAIANNILSDGAGYGINNNSGANSDVVKRWGNDFYNNTSGTENGFGDHPALSGQTESSSPFTNAGTSDFSLVTGANAKANGQPGRFENESFTSYLDIGAVQRQEAGGSGGATRLVNGGLVAA